MNERTALPAWIIFLLIALGVALAVGVALLFTQLDTFQQRSMLPQATLPVVDSEATIAAGDLTVVVIIPDEFVTSTPSPTSESQTATADAGAAGQTETPIFVPTCAAVPDGWIPYAVTEEDTLVSLSLRFNVSIEMLSLANCTLEEGKFVAGQIIFVPSLTPTPTATVTGECVPPVEWILYLAKEGDTLVGLAMHYDTTVEELIENNCLDEIALAPGQELYIPVAAMHIPMPPPDLSGPAMPQGPQMHPQPPAPPHKPPGWPPAYRPTPIKPSWPTATSWPTSVPPAATVTATNVPTMTHTPTATPTPSATATTVPPTATATATSTQPSKAMSTATYTPTPSLTPTNTTEPTATPTIELVQPTVTTAAEEPTPTETATPLPTPIITPEPEAYPYP